MKRLISVIATLLFLTVPTLLLAEGIEGAQTQGKDSSSKAEKIGVKTSKAKKKVVKKTKKTKKKAKKPRKQADNQKDMGTMPAHP